MVTVLLFQVYFLRLQVVFASLKFRVISQCDRQYLYLWVVKYIQHSSFPFRPESESQIHDSLCSSNNSNCDHEKVNSKFSYFQLRWVVPSFDPIRIAYYILCDHMFCLFDLNTDYWHNILQVCMRSFWHFLWYPGKEPQNGVGSCHVYCSFLCFVLCLCNSCPKSYLPLRWIEFCCFLSKWDEDEDQKTRFQKAESWKKRSFVGVTASKSRWKKWMWTIPSWQSLWIVSFSGSLSQIPNHCLSFCLSVSLSLCLSLSLSLSFSLSLPISLSLSLSLSLFLSLSFSLSLSPSLCRSLARSLCLLHSCDEKLVFSLRWENSCVVTPKKNSCVAMRKLLWHKKKTLVLRWENSCVATQKKNSCVAMRKLLCCNTKKKNCVAMRKLLCCDERKSGASKVLPSYWHS